MSKTAAPAVEWVDLASLTADPYPTYERLRREAPVAYVPHLDRYFISTFRDCFDAEMDQQTFSSHEDATRSTMYRSMGRPLIRKDDPEHKLERNAMSAPLRPVAVKKQWRAMFEQNAEKYIAVLKQQGPGADLFAHFAVPYAADNLSAVIGFDDVPAMQMMAWSHTLIRGIGNVANDQTIWTQTDTVSAQIDVAIDRALAKNVEPGTPSMISSMRGVIDEESLRANVKLTISGGMNEPSHVISSAVWALSAFPKQREVVLAGERTWRDVFEETARFQSPVGMYPRRTTREVEVRGITIPENATVAVLVASANRDEGQFESPDNFDLSRDSTSHLAFGNGTHICAGNWIARAMVGEVALPRLYQALPGLEVIDPPTTDFRGWVFRGTTSLPVTWTA